MERGISRARLVERLRARRPEIEAAIFARVCDVVSERPVNGDAEYMLGLGAAATALVEYAIASIEQGERGPGPIPSAAVDQVRRAARAGVGLQTVLMRYIAGHRLFEEFVAEEADRTGFSSHRTALLDLHKAQGLLLEGLTKTIAAEHRQERERMSRSPEQRRSELVQRLLAGESVDISPLDYEFDAWHTCAILTGTGASKASRSLAGTFGGGLLAVCRGEQSVWVWLAARHSVSHAELEITLSRAVPAGVRVALGEPASGIEGFRFTHRQAQAALHVALLKPQRFTWYADVPLLAAVLGDEVASRSLSECYLAPLGARKGAGGTRRETLRAYFAAERNTSSAAVKLKVDPRTVERRLRKIEELLGPLFAHQAEIELALTLEELREAAPGAGESRPA